MTDITIDHEAEQNRYTAVLDGEVIGEAVYQDQGDDRVFVHTEIRSGNEGRGFGTALVRGALDDTREAGLTPVGQCSMVRHFLDEHPEYARPAAS